MTTRFSSNSRPWAAWCASLSMSSRLDAALILAVSLCLLTVRIILPIT